MTRKNKILDKCESMVLLCIKASSYWSLIKFIFAVPLVLTSSAMCIINSISTDANDIKIPNIIVNAVSVLIISLNNSIKASEKFEMFKKLSQQFMLLSQEIEGIEDDEIDNDTYKLIMIKYDNLIQDCAFEEIPFKYKQQVSDIYTKANRFIPLQLNGVLGNLSVKNNSSRNVLTEP